LNKNLAVLFLFLVLICDLSVASDERYSVAKWQGVERTSQMDDSLTYLVSLEANSTIYAWPDRKSKPTLFVRYFEGKLDVILNLGVYAETSYDGFVDLKLRFDSKLAKEYRGSRSSDRESVFFFDTGELIREIAKSDKLIVRFTPFHSDPVTTTFDLSGFEEISKPMLRAADFKVVDKNLIFEKAYSQALESSIKPNQSATANSIEVNRNVITVYTPGECCFSSYREKLTKNKIIATLKPLNTLSSNQDFSLNVTINGSHVGKVKAGKFEKARFLDFHLKKIFLETFNELGLDDELIERIETKTVTGNEFVTIKVNIK